MTQTTPSVEAMREAIDTGLRAFCSSTPDFDMSSAMRRAAADFIMAEPGMFLTPDDGVTIPADGRAANLVGQSFGSLTVTGAARRGGRKAWTCVCKCGGTHVVTTANLRSGNVTNCGCERSQRRREAPLQHGDNPKGGRTKEYRAWCHIRGRCENPADGSYQWYGAKGIRVHSRWQDYKAFLADMGRAPSPHHSIDRIDPQGDYAPGNCRWSTDAEQSRNTSRNVMVDGVCLKDACAARGISYEAAQARIRRGATIEQALSPLVGHAFRKMMEANRG